MKLKLYRGAKLTEALKILDGKLPHTNTYRITDRKEAEFYAYQNKITDKNGRGSLIQATLKTTNIYTFKFLSPEEYQAIDTDGSLDAKQICVYQTDLFDVYLIPKTLLQYLSDFQIVGVV